LGEPPSTTNSPRTALVKGVEHFDGVNVHVEFGDPEADPITQRKEISFEAAIREVIERKLSGSTKYQNYSKTGSEQFISAHASSLLT
jgi:hypothetical protein